MVNENFIPLIIEPKTWVVYKHTCPNEKIYIGITSVNVKERWDNGWGYKQNNHFMNAIKKYKWENIKHEVLYENLTLDEAVIKEQELIKEYKSYDPAFGYNKTFGGEGQIPTEETREKMRLAQLGDKNHNWGKTMSDATKMKLHDQMINRYDGEKNPFYGCKHCPEIREELSEIASRRTGEKNAFYGKHHTEESKQKMREARRNQVSGFKGKHFNEEGKLKLSIANSKPISQYTLNGEFVRDWIGCTAASRELGIGKDGINRCCNGITNKYKGYIWKFKNKED